MCFTWNKYLCWYAHAAEEIHTYIHRHKNSSRKFLWWRHYGFICLKFIVKRSIWFFRRAKIKMPYKDVTNRQRPLHINRTHLYLPFVCLFESFSFGFTQNLHKLLVVAAFVICLFFCLYSILERIPNAIEPHCYSFWIHKYKCFSAKVKCSPIFFLQIRRKEKSGSCLFRSKIYILFAFEHFSNGKLNL